MPSNIKLVLFADPSLFCDGGREGEGGGIVDAGNVNLILEELEFC